MKCYPLIFVITALLSQGSLNSEIVLSQPLGFNKITCLVNSDTIVGVPFRREGSIRTLTTGVPLDVTEDPDLKEIPLGTLNLNLSSLNQHYLKFNGGTHDGRWYDIINNSATSVTIDLNGDNIEGVAADDPVAIIEYWTLDTLFPPAGATNPETGWTEDPVGSGNWVANGHAIVASDSLRGNGRRTELLIPDIAGTGINRASPFTYYCYNGQWYFIGGETEDYGNTLIFPDIVLTIRHPGNVSHPTQFQTSGEVITENLTIPLHTQTDGQRDTFVGLPRPVDVKLSELNLWQSGAFVASSGRARRDELLFFDNTQVAINKATTRTYYHDGTKWYLFGDPDTNRDNDVIPAGSGFIIRKHPTGSGETLFWKNTASY